MKLTPFALLTSAAIVSLLNPARGQTHFSDCASATGSNASVLIEPTIVPTLDGVNFASGDEVAVYNSAGQCAGAEVWTGSVIAITVWSDDPFTTEVDGMAANETMRFVMWDKSTGKEVGRQAGSSVTVTYDPNAPYRGNGSFVSDAIYRLRSLVGQSPQTGNAAPNATFSASPRNGVAPLAVSFDASGSSDSDGTISSYGWVFGDGTTGSGVAPQHSYSNPGTYSARLTVVDNNGASASATTTISVSAAGNVAPTASIQASPLSGVAPLTVAFNGTGSTDSDGTIGVYAWTFGDGATATGASIQHLYPSAGTFTARLTVTDDKGATGTTTVQVVVAPANQSPTSVFVASPMSGVAPLEVGLNANQSSDPDGSIASYFWNHGDGSTGAGKNSVHTYTTPGTYTLSLTITDDRGATATSSKTITVTGAGNNAPSAVVTATPQSGTVPLTVSFNGSGSSDSDGTIASYLWSFGDGTGGTGSTPQHVYSSAGTYSALLTVTDDDGATGTKSIQIVASEPQNSAPSAAFVAQPTSGVAPLLVLLNANQSQDSDGSIVSYSWSYGDNSTGSGKNVGHTYELPGEYSLQLTVTDDDGASASVSRTISVSPGVNEQPVANFTATPRTGSAPLLVSVDASGSSDPDGSIVSFAWSFGDGSNGTGKTLQHTYATPGSYTLRLTVTDNDGALSSRTESITVSGGGKQAPTAAFVASPRTGTVPLLVLVNANQSTDPDGTIVSYEWDYGDGITGSSKNASHTYLTPGSYELTLTITDNDGQVATTSKTINANSSANSLPTASFSASPTFGDAPLLVFFDATASFDLDGSINSYSWNFGDGINGTGAKPVHTFLEPDNYTVTLTVTDDRGGTASSENLIRVTSDIGDQPDMVLRLPLDSEAGGSVPDESGKDQQAMLMNGAVYDPSGGIEGGAVIFDGVDDYVDIADNESLNLLPVTHRTISIWFKVVDRFLSSHKQVIYEEGGNLRGMSIYVYNGTLYAGGWNSVASESGWAGTFLQTGSVRSNQWHHVALVLDGRLQTVQNGVVRAYLDGARFGIGPGSQIWGHEDDIGIGAVDGEARFHDGFVSGAAHAFQGTIDEIRVYDAVLGDAAIRDLASFSGQEANQAPAAQFIFNPTTAQAPANITFDASASGDPDGSIVLYAWDFDDSTTGNGRTVSHQYANPGAYTINLLVTDDDGAIASAVGTLVVTSASNNSKPVAEFSATPVEGFPLSIRFDASASRDPDGTLDQYVWDFGDGQSKVGKVLTHDYENGGAYLVKLTVVDNSGATTVKQLTLEVETAFPEALQPSIIGPLGLIGDVSFQGNQWQVSVPGTQWDPRVDAVLFVHRPVSNDVELTVRVDSVAVEDSLLFAGVGIRGGLSPTDANAAVAVSGTDRVVFTYRAASGGWEIESASAAVTLPVWTRITRIQKNVIGAYSLDGESWTQLADQVLPIETQINGGIVAHTSDPNRIGSATMSELSVSMDEEVTLVEAPAVYQLSESYPNPFSDVAQFTLLLPREENVNIAVFDLSGRRVQVLQDGPLAGDQLHRIYFDGSRLASGLYLVRFIGDSFFTSRKATLVR